MSSSDLARRALITVQSMQATLNQLEGLGAIERRMTPGRGRTARRQLTEAGQELLVRAMDVLRAVDRQLAAELGPDDHRVLSRVLLRAFTAINRRGDASPDEEPP